MPVNENLLRECVRWIEEHPERWDQTTFVHTGSACGTTYCLAGVAVFLTHPENENVYVTVDDRRWDTSSLDPLTISGYARELLGLTHEQAEYLFFDVIGHHLHTGQPNIRGGARDVGRFKKIITEVTGVALDS